MSPLEDSIKRSGMNSVAQVPTASMEQLLEQLQEPEPQYIETDMGVGAIEKETVRQLQSPPCLPSIMRHISLHNSSRHLDI
jgi:hypothetical protein